MTDKVVGIRVVLDDPRDSVSIAVCLKIQVRIQNLMSDAVHEVEEENVWKAVE